MSSSSYGQFQDTFGDDFGMTRPREWPNAAKEARDRAAEEAARGLYALRPMLERDMADAERFRRLAVAVDAFQTILRLLEREGAQTRP